MDAVRKYSIKELRSRHNWNQATTAQKLGISLTTYNAWERNFGRVKARDALRVAELFGVRLDEIDIGA